MFSSISFHNKGVFNIYININYIDLFVYSLHLETQAVCTAMAGWQMTMIVTINSVVDESS